MLFSFAQVLRNKVKQAAVRLPNDKASPTRSMCSVYGHIRIYSVRDASLQCERASPLIWLLCNSEGIRCLYSYWNVLSSFEGRFVER
jgi:hypothetical protein